MYGRPGSWTGSPARGLEASLWGNLVGELLRLILRECREECDPGQYNTAAT